MQLFIKFSWLLSVIVPFLLLDWKSALLVLFINFIGILPLGILVVAILKPLYGAGHWVLFFFGGVSEAILYVILNDYLDHPKNFLLSLIVVYLFNQLSRVFRGKFQKDEIYTLAGFLTGLGVNLLL